MPSTDDMLAAAPMGRDRDLLLANPDPIVLAQIQEAMQGEKKPCVTATQYYYNSSPPDLTPAVGWLDAYLKNHAGLGLLRLLLEGQAAAKARQKGRSRGRRPPLARRAGG